MNFNNKEGSCLYRLSENAILQNKQSIKSITYKHQNYKKGSSRTTCLQEKLNEFRKNFESGGPPLNVSPDIITSIHRATDELRASGIIERILKPDDRAPEFSLPNANGDMIQSKYLLAKGNLVISFYRGGW